MPLYESIGLTNLHTAFDTCFALIIHEDQDSFDWVIHQQRALANKHEIPSPAAIITDFCTPLKNSLDKSFPESQQLICIWHITKNVRKYVCDNWEGRGKVENVMAVMQLYANTMENRSRATHVLRDANKQTQNDFLELFWLMMHADEERVFLDAWNGMQARFSDQISKYF